MNTSTFISTIDTTADTLLNYTLSEDTDSSLLSLMGGSPGIALFFAHYYELTGQQKYIDKAAEIIEESFEYISTQDDYLDTFAGGTAGLAWLVNHFMQKGWIKKDEAVLEQFDDYLETIGRHYFTQGSYDYLHGGIGIALYWLERETCTEYLREALQLLEKHVIRNEYGTSWLNQRAFYLKSTIPDYQEVNFSLSHGLVSIIHFLTMLHAKDIEPNKCQEMIMDTVKFIKNYPSEKNAISEFPGRITVDSDGNYNIGSPTRLAWCYGDLGMAVVFLQAGLQLEDTALIDYAKTLGLKTINRKSFEDTMLYDAGICHGIFGVALLYKKLFKYSACQEFEQAANYWLIEGIQHLKTNPIETYKSKHADTWVEDMGLLTGSAGIGMSILDMLHPEITQTDGTNWDRILLLS